MRVALVIAVLAGACTTANPAFDPEEHGEPEPVDPACTPGTPLQLVTLGFEPEACGAPLVVAGMVVTQDEGSFTMVECEDECPCDADDEPEIAIALHPEIPIPVFTECIVVHVQRSANDCLSSMPESVTIRGADERLLVHAESLGAKDNAAGVTVSESLVQECACAECEGDPLAPGDYAMSFASADDEVGPLRAGEMAEIAMPDSDGAATWVVKALSTAIDCACAPRRALQWSVTRG
jgi:hypothetical protein